MFSFLFLEQVQQFLSSGTSNGGSQYNATNKSTTHISDDSNPSSPAFNNIHELHLNKLNTYHDIKNDASDVREIYDALLVVAVVSLLLFDVWENHLNSEFHFQ